MLKINALATLALPAHVAYSPHVIVVVQHSPQFSSFFVSCRLEPIRSGLNALSSMGPVKIISRMIPAHYLMTPRPPTILNTCTQTIFILLGQSLQYTNLKPDWFLHRAISLAVLRYFLNSS